MSKLLMSKLKLPVFATGMAYSLLLKNGIR